MLTMSNFCNTCECTYTPPSCSGCTCLGVPNIFANDSLIPCGSSLEIELKGLDLCVCNGLSPTVTITQITPNIEVVSSNINRVIIKSLSNIASELYEIYFTVCCGGYSSQGSIKGYTKDLCKGAPCCDPCTGVITPSDDPSIPCDTVQELDCTLLTK